MRRQSKSIAVVVESLAEERRVDGEHQRLEAGPLGASYQLDGDVTLAIDVELEEAKDIRCSFGDLLDARRRNRAQGEGGSHRHGTCATAVPQ